MRRLLLALAVIVGALAAIRWWPDAAPTIAPVEKSEGDRAKDAVAPETPTPAPALAIDVVRDVEPPRSAPIAATEIAAPPDAATASAAGATLGRVVLHDFDGSLLPPGSGTMQGYWMEGGSGSGSDDVTVTSGRFSVTIPAGRTFKPSRLELDGQLVHVEEKPVVPDAAGELVIDARRIAGLTLHVIDATTRAELPRVTVLRNRGFPFDDFDHPGSSRSRDALADAQPSPLTLAVPDGSHRVDWSLQVNVGAEGHAWRVVELDFTRGGEQTVELDAGGTLEVALVGDRSARPAPAGPSDDYASRFERVPQPVLRVRKPFTLPGGEPPFDADAALASARQLLATLSEEQRSEAFPDGVVPDDATLRDLLVKAHEESLRFVAQHETMTVVAEVEPEDEGITRIDGLPAGRCVVALELGNHWDKPRLFAREEVEVRAAATAHVTLVLREEKRPEAVALSGRVRLAPEWNKRSIDLHFEPLDVPGGSSADEVELDVPTRGSAAGPEWHPFDAGQVLPGRWLVKSYGFEFQQVIDTGPSGRTDAEIVVGDPADVAVKLIDAATGATIVVADPRALLWNCARPEGSTGGSLDEAKRDETAGLWRFRAPAGPIELQLTGEAAELYDGFEPGVVRVAPGRNELAYTLRPVQTLEVRFEVDGHRLTASGPVRPIHMGTAALTRAGSNARAAATRWSDSVIWFTLPEPGRWRLEIARLPGYRAVEPVEIEVAPRQVTVHRVALVPEE